MCVITILAHHLSLPSNSIYSGKRNVNKMNMKEHRVMLTLPLFLWSCSGMTTWKCEMVWTRVVSWWGSTVGRLLPLQLSPLEISFSSSLCLTMRLMEQVFPSDMRSSRQVGGKIQLQLHFIPVIYRITWHYFESMNNTDLKTDIFIKP